LITTVQSRATDLLHGGPKGATYKESLEALEDRFGDQHLAAANRSQLKQGCRRILPRICHNRRTAAHRAYPALPEDHMGEAGKAFSDGVEHSAIKIQLLLGQKKGEWGFQVGPRVSSRVPSSQAPKHELQDILGEPIVPSQVKSPKTIGLLELCGARPLWG
jgi:hypothetical protein